MLRFIVFILFLFLPSTLFLGGKSSDSTPDSAEGATASDVEAYASLYRSMQLEGVVNWKAFRQAVAGYYKIDNRKREVLTLIDGLEKGINDRARERAIVMHGAAYADPSVVSRGGRLGRSFGCPAVPQKLSRPIIDAIKGGSVMYIYAETPEYLAHSSVLKGADGL